MSLKLKVLNVLFGKLAKIRGLAKGYITEKGFK